MTGPWTESDRARLDALLDQLIPANSDKGIPGAGELGVSEFLTDRAAEDFKLAADIKKILVRLDGNADSVSVGRIRQIEREAPEAFLSLIAATYMGYYSRAQLRPHFGVGSHPVHPNGYAVASETPEQLEELTAPVRKRGAIYRGA